MSPSDPHSEPEAPVHEFEWEAMNTGFLTKIAHEDGTYARQGARAAFQELDRLEGEFSRFIDNSHVSRVNRAAKGEAVRVSRDVLFCFGLAEILAELTGGVFRIAWQSPVEAGAFPLELDSQHLTVTKTHDDVAVDLGGIGKGFGLDCMREVLKDWELWNSLLIGGGSSLLALDPPPGSPGWAVSLSMGGESVDLFLKNRSLSGSGLAVRGQHIVDPRGGPPKDANRRSWAFASNAAESDALSTAFFLLGDPEIEAVCAAHPHLAAAVAVQDPPHAVHWRFFGESTYWKELGRLA